MSDRFIRDMENEMARAERGHAPMSSLHEGYAVILEELEEFWVEVRKKREDRNELQVYDELVQIATMCMRTADNCGVTDAILDFIRQEQREGETA